MANEDHAVTAYAKAVLAGELPAGKPVRLAGARHLRDLERAPARGFRFVERKASHAIAFFHRYLRHYKGDFAGLPLRLDPWEQFIVGSVFGWQRADVGRRRFRIAYNEIPRKNGKSTLGAGVALYCLLCDGEPAAEVYSAATKRDQSKIVFDAGKAMVRRSPDLRAKFGRRGIRERALLPRGTDSIFAPLSADAHSLDGLNVHCGVIDEVHAHKTRALIDVIETATGSRSQPLQFEITTAGFDRLSICFEHHEFALAILEEGREDEAADAMFAYIATFDDGDAWDDPVTWAKANPGLGVSVNEHYLRTLAGKARRLPAARLVFRQRHLNEWTEASEVAFDMDLWAAGGDPIEIEELRGRECFGGLDLARVNDLSAFVLLFPPVARGERWKVLARFWCPDDDIRERGERDRVPYATWRDQGYLEATPGNATDFDFIREQIVEDSLVFDIKEIAFDRHFAHELVQTLEKEGLTMVRFGQGFVSMAQPFAELERLLLAGMLRHGAHPILTWCARNTVARKDPAGNRKPDKEKSREKIDGIVALLNALGRAMMHVDQSTVYDRGQEVRAV